MSAAEDQFALQLDLSGYKGQYEREYRFMRARRFRFDFVLVKERIAVEIDGGTFIQGRHQRPAGFTRDCEKNNLAILEGWRVFHFTPAMIASGEAITVIDNVLMTPSRPREEVTSERE